MKCKCGVELFDKDKVLTKYMNERYNSKGLIDSDGYIEYFRCPKCFKVKKEITKWE